MFNHQIGLFPIEAEEESLPPSKETSTVAVNNALAKLYTAETDRLQNKCALDAIQIKEAKIQLKEHRLASERAQAEHRLWRAQDVFSRVFHFTGDIQGAGRGSPDTVGHCIQTLALWERYDNKSPIRIILSTPGGEVFSGLALFDFIQGLSGRGIEVTIEAHGLVASMGTILLQAATCRAIGRESYLMLHEIAGGGGQVPYSSLEDGLILMGRIQQRIMDIFLTRAGDKLDRQVFEANWKRREWWLSSEEALKLGIVDKVI